jgi:hypothetical protein
VIRRKAEVVAAVRGGLLSLDEACIRYKLTVHEFLAWQLSIERHGLVGLRTTRPRMRTETEEALKAAAALERRTKGGLAEVIIEDWLRDHGFIKARKLPKYITCGGNGRGD